MILRADGYIFVYIHDTFGGQGWMCVCKTPSRSVANSCDVINTGSPLLIALGICGHGDKSAREIWCLSEYDIYDELLVFEEYNPQSFG